MEVVNVFILLCLCAQRLLLSQSMLFSALNHSDSLPGLADDQSITAVLDRMEFQCELRSKGLKPVDESTPEQNTPEHLWLQTSLGQSRYCGHVYVCAAAGVPPKGLRPMDKRPC